MSEFKLEHGKRYVTRDGVPTDFPIVDVRPSGYTSRYPFLGTLKGTNYSWTEAGLQLLGHEVSDVNLVSEYVPPPEPRWVPFDASDRLSLIGKPIRRKQWVKGNAAAIVCVSDMFVGFIEWGDFTQLSYRELFDQCEFADGTPCGKQVPQ